MPVPFIISVLQYVAIKYLSPGITEVPYFIILFINLLVTTWLLCIHDHTDFTWMVLQQCRQITMPFGLSFLKKCWTSFVIEASVVLCVYQFRHSSSLKKWESNPHNCLLLYHWAIRNKRKGNRTHDTQVVEDIALLPQQHTNCYYICTMVLF